MPRTGLSKYLLQILVVGSGLLLSPASPAGEGREADVFDRVGIFPTSELAERLKPWQSRFTGMYGNMRLGSRRREQQSTFYLKGVQAGIRTELERWFQAGNRNRRALGVITDFQFLYVGRFALEGPPVYYGSASAAFAWRVLGYGHSQPWSPEFSVFAGPGLESFPSLIVPLSLKNYTLHQPLVLSSKAGFRLRFPVISSFQMLSAEVTGYHLWPLTTLPVGNADRVSLSGTASSGATAILDFKLGSAVVLGGGVYWGWFTLEYDNSSSDNVQQTSIYTQAFIGSLRFNF